MCELHERAARPNFRLWDGLPDSRISIHSCVKTGSAERDFPANRAQKNFATGPSNVLEPLLFSFQRQKLGKPYLSGLNDLGVENLDEPIH